STTERGGRCEIQRDATTYLLGEIRGIVGNDRYRRYCNGDVNRIACTSVGLRRDAVHHGAGRGAVSTCQDLSDIATRTRDRTVDICTALYNPRESSSGYIVGIRKNN